MIREVTTYQAVCDGCGGSLKNSLTRRTIVFEDEEWLRATCSELDWREINGKLYCPNCYEYDEEKDEYKPKVKED